MAFCCDDIKVFYYFDSDRDFPS